MPVTVSPSEQLTVDVPALALGKGGMRLTGSPVTVGLPAEPRAYLYSGWQSWSLTAWLPAGRRMRPMRPANQQARVADPLYVGEPRPNGSWYGAAELPGGQVVLLGALALESHVALEGKNLKGWSEAGGGEWFLGAGDEATLMARYADLLAERFGRGRAKTSPRVWCSWYSLYTQVDEARLLKALDGWGRTDSPDGMPFEVFQVDDGWQRGVGEWEPNEKFPSGMDGLAARIRASGRTPGLWLAPLLVVPSAAIHRQHPDWLLHDGQGRLVTAGFNWGEPLHALDTTHPGAQDWLAALMKKVRSWGYDYAKLDFLYAGALPGKRHVDMPREAAYRQGLEVIRAALGEAYLLTCGAPVLPSLGLCDGLRISTDVAGQWASRRDDRLLRNFSTPGGRNALRTGLHRLWLRPLVHTDPDVVYFGRAGNTLTAGERALLQDFSLAAGFKASSDLPSRLDPAEKAALREYLLADVPVRQTGRTTFRIGEREVDFSAAIAMPPAPNPLEDLLGALAGRLAESPAVMRLVERLERDRIRRTLDRHPA